MNDTTTMFFKVQQTSTLVRILPGDPLWIVLEVKHDGYEKPIQRFIWRCVARGKEREGVRLLNVSKAVHQELVRGVVELSVPPSMNFWQTMCQGFSSIWGLGWLARFVPPPLNILDLERGYDILIEKEVKQYGSNGFPHFKVAFVEESVPAGTPEQLKEWQKKDVMEAIVATPQETQA